MAKIWKSRKEVTGCIRRHNRKRGDGVMLSKFKGNNDPSTENSVFDNTVTDCDDETDVSSS